MQPALQREAFEQAARDYVAAFDQDADALARLNRHYGRSFSLDDLRADIWRRDYAFRQRSSRIPKNYFPLEEAKILVAQDAGFGSWEKLIAALDSGQPPRALPMLSTRRTTASVRAAGCRRPIGTRCSPS